MTDERKEMIKDYDPLIEIYYKGKPLLVTMEAPVGFTLFSPDMDFAIEFRESTDEEKLELEEVENEIEKSRGAKVC